MTPFVSYNLFICQKVNILVACCFLYYSWHYIILQNIQSCILKGCKVTNPKESCTTTTTFRLSKIPSGASIITATGPIVFQFADLLRNFFVSLWWTAPFSTILWGFHCPLRLTNVEKNQSWQYRKMQRPRGLLKPLLNIEKYGKLEAPTKSNSSAPRNTAETTAIWAKEENAIQVTEGCISQLNCISLNAKKRRSMFLCVGVLRKKKKNINWEHGVVQMPRFSKCQSFKHHVLHVTVHNVGGNQMEVLLHVI